ncbi:MAG: 4Fe-4S binding protein [archaeon]|nr:MAG: 4Fe-4S binding protein [archaeon]
MPVLINFKICDNAKECGGITACKSGAIYWDKEKKTIAIDNSKCTGCGECVKECPVGAIRLAKTDEEYERIKKEIEEDPRKTSDLFVDRYGAQPIHDYYLTTSENFDSEVVQSNKLTVAELFNDDSIQCLLDSIPIKDLFEGIDIKYKKVELKDNSLLEKYEIKELPSLLFFKDGKLLGRIEGYKETKDKEAVKQEIKEITSKS